MASEKKVYICLVKGKEYTTVWDGGYSPMTPPEMVLVDDIDVSSNDISEYVYPAELKQIAEVIQLVKSRTQPKRYLLAVEGSFDYESLKISCNNLILRELQNVLRDPVIRIEGTMNASYKDSALVSDVPVNIVIKSCEGDLNKWHSIPFNSSVITEFMDNIEYSILDFKFTLHISLEWTKFVVIVKMNADSILRKMFDDDSNKEFTIRASEHCVKCHGAIFAAHCPAFQRMISESCNMKESQSKHIDFSEDLSKNGVTCLVQYLYGLEIVFPDRACELICELLKFAHKYELKDLESSLFKILLQMNLNWYTSDTIKELLSFAELVDEFEPLRAYLLQIMMRIPDLETDDI